MDDNCDRHLWPELDRALRVGLIGRNRPEPLYGKCARCGVRLCYETNGAVTVIEDDD